MSKGKRNNKNALIGLGATFFVCLACIGFFSPEEANITSPTFDPAKIGTVIVETMNAAAIQTQTAAATYTSLPTLTLADTPSPTSTNTQISLIFETSTIPVVIIPAASASCVPNLPPQTGTVVDVVDGDTIKVLRDDGLIYSVRYIGMDTPENTSQIEYFGPESTAKNYELVMGQTVTMYSDVSDKDRYGRLLRYVFVGNMFVNYELVAQGYANAVTYPPDVACSDYFASAQNIAATSGLGLWGASPTLAVVIPIATSGGVAACSCSYNQYNCSNFSSRSEAQACFNYCISVGAGDVHRLDSDNDGAVCESMR